MCVFFGDLSPLNLSELIRKYHSSSFAIPTFNVSLYLFSISLFLSLSDGLFSCFRPVVSRSCSTSLPLSIPLSTPLPLSTSYSHFLYLSYSLSPTFPHSPSFSTSLPLSLHLSLSLIFSVSQCSEKDKERQIDSKHVFYLLEKSD